jgi:excinuclease ABC subunit B
MAEELAKYLTKVNIRCHSLKVDTGTNRNYARFTKRIFDVLIGVNLLREGLDLPEVSW